MALVPVSRTSFRKWEIDGCARANTPPRRKELTVASGAAMGALFRRTSLRYGKRLQGFAACWRDGIDCSRPNGIESLAIERGLQRRAERPGHRQNTISAVGQDPPRIARYRGLVETGVLSGGTSANACRRVAGFRNVLVHGYLEVDLELVAAVLKRPTDLFDGIPPPCGILAAERDSGK